MTDTWGEAIERLNAAASPAPASEAAPGPESWPLYATPSPEAPPRLGERMVRSAPAVEVTEDELIALCRERLAGYKKPAAVVFVDELPRNAAGKVLKRQLRDTYAEVAAG